MQRHVPMHLPYLSILFHWYWVDSLNTGFDYYSVLSKSIAPVRPSPSHTSWLNSPPGAVHVELHGARHDPHVLGTGNHTTPLGLKYIQKDRCACRATGFMPCGNGSHLTHSLHSDPAVAANPNHCKKGMGPHTHTQSTARMKHGENMRGPLLCLKCLPLEPGKPGTRRTDQEPCQHV